MVCAGCVTPVRLREVRPDVAFRRLQSNAITTDTPSPHTAQVLRQYALENTFPSDPRAGLARLHAQVCGGGDRYILFGMAELSYLAARNAERRHPQEALGYYVSAARYAYGFVFEGGDESPSPYDPRFRLACDLYNHSLARGIRLLRETDDASPFTGFDAELWDGPIRVSVEKSGFSPEVASFSDLLLATDYEVKGIRNHYRTFGLGVPLIAVVDPASLGPHLPPRGSLPATAFLRFHHPACAAAGPQTATLELFDPLHITEVEIDGVRAPLESDTTTPLGYLLANRDLQLAAVVGLVKGERIQDNTGLYMLEPYETDKIPVVMVHGLVSSPLTWAEMLNDLRGDPLIRERYQFWFFLYPTGYPFSYSASILRNALLQLRKTYDPENDDPAFDQMVLVGHSMGGLLSKMMVQDSGDALWSALSRKPFDEINATAQEKDLIRDVLFFEPLHFVKRVVFIATPHRGSTLSDGPFAVAVSALIAIPKFAIEGAADLLLRNPDLPREDLNKRNLTSVRNLSPRNPLIIATAKLPIATGVVYHTIYGNPRGVDPAGSSDGIVPYSSAHLDGAESELGVPAGHSCHLNAVAILEARRILYLHAGLVAPSSVATASEMAPSAALAR